MRLTTLSDNTLLLEHHLNVSKVILRESCDGLTLQQRKVVEGIYNEFVPLIEASLTADQIKGIFKGVEQAAVAGGDNRTLAGLGVDGVKKVNDTVNQIGKWLQNTTPVKNFDAKFEQLKNTINKKYPDSKFLDMVSEMGMWAQENPGKTAAIIGVLTAIASLAGGPVGGAIAGQILKGSVELLKGEKLSTAIGKGLKTAAFGYITGAVLDKFGDWLRSFTAKFVPYNSGIVKGNFSYSSNASWTGGSNSFSSGHEGYFLAADKEKLSALVDTFNSTTDAEAKADAWSQFTQLLDQTKSDAYFNTVVKTADEAQKLALANSNMYNAVSTITKSVAAAGQGAATAAASRDKKESYYLQTRPLSEGQVYLMLRKIAATEQLDEGPMDWLKKGAAAVGKGVQRVGQNITNKVTYEKLLAGWKLDGSPTDSEAIKKFLNSMEVSDNIINQVFADMKIGNTDQQAGDTPKAQSAYMQVKNAIPKMDKKGRQRLALFLQKQLGTA